MLKATKKRPHTGICGRSKKDFHCRAQLAVLLSVLEVLTQHAGGLNSACWECQLTMLGGSADCVLLAGEFLVAFVAEFSVLLCK